LLWCKDIYEELNTKLLLFLSLCFSAWSLFLTRYQHEPRSYQLRYAILVNLFLYEWLYVFLLQFHQLESVPYRYSKSLLCEWYYIIVFIYSLCILEVLHNDWPHIIKFKKKLLCSSYEKFILFYMNSWKFQKYSSWKTNIILCEFLKNSKE
jgi:hypothetical protein